MIKIQWKIANILNFIIFATQLFQYHSEYSSIYIYIYIYIYINIYIYIYIISKKKTIIGHISIIYLC